MDRGGEELNREGFGPLTDLFGSDTQGRLIFDLVRTIVANRLKIRALEGVLVGKGVISREELDGIYESALSSSSDDVINEVLQEFGGGNTDY